jgi:hypothetical protein
VRGGMVERIGHERGRPLSCPPSWAVVMDSSLVVADGEGGANECINDPDWGPNGMVFEARNERGVRNVERNERTPSECSRRQTCDQAIGGEPCKWRRG